MKRSVPVEFLPTRWRERYGDEIEALLRQSHHPVADLVDLVKHVARWYLEEAMKDIWKSLSIILAIVSVFALGYAISDLAGGISELPRHWWSTAPVLGLVLAAAAGILARARSRRC